MVLIKCSIENISEFSVLKNMNLVNEKIRKHLINTITNTLKNPLNFTKTTKKPKSNKNPQH